MIQIMDNIIYYTFLAGWCGDAVGARLEFRKTRYTETEAMDAMHFTGMNTSGVEIGQITDDSEMEICLLNALSSSRNEEFFPIETICKEYIDWYKSEPFDIGQTITYSLIDAKDATDMLTNAFENNQHSESNGSLMRCIPLAVFEMDQEIETIMTIAKVENELTHPNPLVGEITGIYCVVIAQILKGRKNGEEIDFNSILEMIHSQLITNPKVSEWFSIGSQLTNLKEYDCIRNEGHVKHAFILVIYFLHHICEYTYETAICEVLQCGGDTDTNAKIVGNFFGAYYGNCVPSYMSDPVIRFDCTAVDNQYFRRPFQYGVKHAIQLIELL